MQNKQLLNLILLFTVCIFLTIIYAIATAWLVNYTNNIPKNTPSPTIAGIETIRLIRITDGDTIKVEISGTQESIRLIGINTPEIKHGSIVAECFGEQAKQHLAQLLTDKPITLEADDTQQDRDKYGRLLRYIFIGNENINLKMIADGYAYEYTYKLPYKYQFQFKEAQNNAEKTKSGLWGAECND